MSKISNLLRAVADLLEEDGPRVHHIEIPSAEKSSEKIDHNSEIKEELINAEVAEEAKKIAYDTWALLTGVERKPSRNPFAVPQKFDPTTWERKQESEQRIAGYDPLKPVIKTEEEMIPATEKEISEIYGVDVPISECDGKPEPPKSRKTRRYRNEMNDSIK